MILVPTRSSFEEEESDMQNALIGLQDSRKIEFEHNCHALHFPSGRQRESESSGMLFSDRWRAPTVRQVVFRSSFRTFMFLCQFLALFCTFITKHIKILKQIKYANNGHVMQLDTQNAPQNDLKIVQNPSISLIYISFKLNMSGMSQWNMRLLYLS